MSRFSYLVCALCVAMLCLVVAGCGSNKVTPENFAKIKNGMSESDVTDILGAPDSANEQANPMFGNMKMKMCTWQSGESKIVIGFINGKVKTQNGNFR